MTRHGNLSWLARGITLALFALIIATWSSAPALAHHRQGHDRPTAPADADADGVADSTDNCVSTPNPDQADSDSDGIGDACEAPTPEPDRDYDGVPDSSDNCMWTSNSDQSDLDGDGVGDACDPDFPSVDQLWYELFGPGCGGSYGCIGPIPMPIYCRDYTMPSTCGY